MVGTSSCPRIAARFVQSLIASSSQSTGRRSTNVSAVRCPLGAGEFDETVQEFGQLQRVGANSFEVVAVGLVEGARIGELEDAEHSVQRCRQLVAELGKEALLGLRRHGDGSQRLAEFGRALRDPVLEFPIRLPEVAHATFGDLLGLLASGPLTHEAALEARHTGASAEIPSGSCSRRHPDAVTRIVHELSPRCTQVSCSTVSGVSNHVPVPTISPSASAHSARCDEYTTTRSSPSSVTSKRGTSAPG